MDAILCKDVVKRFGKDVIAVNHISFRAQEQKVLGLLGPNGAGKTTLVRMMTTVLRPDEGTIEVLGHDVVKEARAVRFLLGLAGQYAAVDENLTGYENLFMVAQLNRLGRKESRKRAESLLEQFGLTHAAKRQAKTYSGGMRRRLDLAAALVADPKVLFLDEPTTGLDPQSRLALWDMILELVKAGTTLLLTTQYLEEADKLADDIIVVNNGKIIAQGTPHELKSKLGAKVIHLSFEAENLANKTYKLMQENFGEVFLENHEVSIVVEDESTSLFKCLKILDKNNIKVSNVALKEPTLDEVFLELTRT